MDITSVRNVTQFSQKPIRVETCNARSQLPNIQCELIGWMFQCYVPYLETPSLLLFQIWYLANLIFRSLFPSTQGTVTRFNPYGFLVFHISEVVKRAPTLLVTSCACNRIGVASTPDIITLLSVSFAVGGWESKVDGCGIQSAEGLSL